MTMSSRKKQPVLVCQNSTGKHHESIDCPCSRYSLSFNLLTRLPSGSSLLHYSQQLIACIKEHGDHVSRRLRPGEPRPLERFQQDLDVMRRTRPKHDSQKDLSHSLYSDKRKTCVSSNVFVKLAANCCKRNAA